MKNKFLSLVVAAFLAVPVMGMDDSALPGDGEAPRTSAVGVEAGAEVGPDLASVVAPVLLPTEEAEDVPTPTPAPAAVIPAPTDIPSLIAYLNGPGRALLTGITRADNVGLQTSLAFFREAADAAMPAEPCICMNCATGASRGVAIPLDVLLSMSF